MRTKGRGSVYISVDGSRNEMEFRVFALHLVSAGALTHRSSTKSHAWSLMKLNHHRHRDLLEARFHLLYGLRVATRHSEIWPIKRVRVSPPGADEPSRTRTIQRNPHYKAKSMWTPDHHYPCGVLQQTVTTNQRLNRTCG